MNEKIKRALLVYMSMTENERLEFKRKLKEFDEKILTEKQRFNEDIRKSLGPLSGSCPYCGK